MFLTCSFIVFIALWGAKILWQSLLGNSDWIQPQNVVVVILLLGYSVFGGFGTLFALSELGGISRSYWEEHKGEIERDILLILIPRVFHFIFPIFLVIGWVVPAVISFLIAFVGSVIFSILTERNEAGGFEWDAVLSGLFNMF